LQRFAVARVALAVTLAGELLQAVQCYAVVGATLTGIVARNLLQASLRYGATGGGSGCR